MAQAIEQAIQLVSGAFGAVSFDQLQPGTLVNDEFGRFLGFVVGPYISPNAYFHAVDTAAIHVIVQVDPANPTFTVIGEQVALSGRFLEPVQHGPKHLLAGYDLLRRLVLEPEELTWNQRNRP